MITDVTDRPASNFLVNTPVECSVSSSLTSLETLYIEHKWTVDSFAVHMDLSPVAEYLTSPVFGSKDNRYKFNLRLYPTGKDEECRSYVSLFLMIRECPGQKIRFKVNFFVETTDGPKYCALNRHVVAINKGGIVTASKFFAVEFLKSRSQRFLPNDTLTVGVQLAIFGDTVSSEVSRDEISAQDDFTIPDPCLATDMQFLLDNETHTDCELWILAPTSSNIDDLQNGISGANLLSEEDEEKLLLFETTTDDSPDLPGPSTLQQQKMVVKRRERSPPPGTTIFKCHKAILSARSAVFAAMFDHDMRESQSSVCKIHDLTPTAVRAVLQFLYAGCCPQIEECAEEILPAADKYQVILLKDQCERHLARKICADNVCRFLKFADKHSAPLLRRKAVSFFREHKQEVLTSDPWDALESEDPQLAAQTLRHILTNDRNPTSAIGGGAASQSNTMGLGSGANNNASQSSNSYGVTANDVMRRRAQSPNAFGAAHRSAGVGSGGGKRTLPVVAMANGGAGRGSGDNKRARFS